VDASDKEIQPTVAQAVVKFLARQYCQGDGLRRRLVEGCSGIRFVKIKVADLDGHKLSRLCVLADAREGLQALTTPPAGDMQNWHSRVERATWQRAWEDVGPCRAR
jgi:TPP-dependent trihydroxycyclohexane-1,2-dione (THcHDO) dehydratase